MDILDILIAKALSTGASPEQISAAVQAYLEEHPIDIPEMATQADMGDWTSGKTVDAAVLKTDFAAALLELEGLDINKADRTEIPTKTSDLTNDSDYQTAAQVQTAIAAKDSGFVTPEDFGAKGDGVADDTEALKAAIRSGNPIALQEGKNYLIASTIEARAPFILDGNGATISTVYSDSAKNLLILHDSVKSAIIRDVDFRTTVGASATGAHGETIPNRSNLTAIVSYALDKLLIDNCSFTNFDTGVAGAVASGDTDRENVLDTLVVENCKFENVLCGVGRTCRKLWIDKTSVKLDSNAQTGEHCIYMATDVMAEAFLTDCIFNANNAKSNSCVQFYPDKASNIVNGYYLAENCVFYGDGFITVSGGGVFHANHCVMKSPNYNTTNRIRGFGCQNSGGSALILNGCDIEICLQDNALHNIQYINCDLHKTALTGERMVVQKADKCRFENIGITLYDGSEITDCKFSSPVSCAGHYYVAVDANATAAKTFMSNCIFRSGGLANTIAYNAAGYCTIVNAITSLGNGGSTDNITFVNKISAL